MNQVSGNPVGVDDIRDDIINAKDGCFDCSSFGPDCIHISKIEQNLKCICFDNKTCFKANPNDFRYVPKSSNKVYVNIVDGCHNGCYAVPFIDKEVSDTSSVRMGFINSKFIKILIRKGGHSIDAHNLFLLNNAQATATYPLYDLMKFKDIGITFLVKDENGFDVIVSNWAYSVNIEATFEDCNFRMIMESISHTYGERGFGDRKRSQCLGRNVYSGRRSGIGMVATPRTGQTKLGNSQYNRQEWRMMCRCNIEVTNAKENF